eukprot:COSAG01_NODE_2398_length_7765_cov_29.002087_10_plen_56_part_00
MGGGAELERLDELVANRSTYSVARFEHHYALLFDYRYGQSYSNTTSKKHAGLDED